MDCGHRGLLNKEPCTLPMGHKSKCSWGGDSEEPNWKKKSEYKKEVKGCTACPSSEVFHDPKYGIGQWDRPKFLVIDCITPLEPEGRRVGALSAKFKEKYWAHKQVVQDLVKYFGDAFFTRSPMCPSVFSPNWPARRVAEHCTNKFVPRLVDSIKPEYIVTFGEARYTVAGHTSDFRYPLCDINGGIPGSLVVKGRVIALPRVGTLRLQYIDMDHFALTMSKAMERIDAS